MAFSWAVFPVTFDDSVSETRTTVPLFTVLAGAFICSVFCWAGTEIEEEVTSDLQALRSTRPAQESTIAEGGAYLVSGKCIAYLLDQIESS